MLARHHLVNCRNKFDSSSTKNKRYPGTRRYMNGSRVNFMRLGVGNPSRICKKLSANLKFKPKLTLRYNKPGRINGIRPNKQWND